MKLINFTPRSRLQTLQNSKKTAVTVKVFKMAIFQYLCIPSLTLYHTVPTFNDPKEEGLGKHCGKRKKCWQPTFSSFTLEFSNLSKREIFILAMFNMLSANAFSLVTSESFSFGKGLIVDKF